MDELQAQLDADVAGLEAGDGPLSSWTGTFGGPGGVTVSFFGPAWGLQNHAQCEELSASGGKRKGSRVRVRAQAAGSPPGPECQCQSP